MKYAYFPGCSLHSTAKEYDESIRKVFSKLDIALEEPKGWVCCGASSAHSIDPVLSVALPAQTLSSIESLGHSEVVVPCASCFQRFKTAAHEMKQSDPLEQVVATAVGRKYGYSVTPRHPVEVLERLVASGAAKDRLVRSLGKMKLACYYGCMLTRPPKVMGFDECEYPMTMDRLLAALGAEPLDWCYKTDCCGASLALNEPEVVQGLVRDILADAVDSGAEAIVVACQLCQSNLDVRQGQVNARFSTDFRVPIIYFSQLVGLALGLGQDELGFGRLMADPMPLLRKYSLA